MWAVRNEPRTKQIAEGIITWKHRPLGRNAIKFMCQQSEPIFSSANENSRRSEWADWAEPAERESRERTEPAVWVRASGDVDIFVDIFFYL